MLTDLTFRRMMVEDLPVVQEFERVSFPAPWSQSMFERDIIHNKLAHIYVVEHSGELTGSAPAAPPVPASPTLAGYFSMWKIVDEGHLVTLVVSPALRRQGLGRAIMNYIFTYAASLGIRKLTLEVSRENIAAIRLYTALGFIKSGTRLRYYADGSDAWIMDLPLDIPPNSARQSGLASSG